jgi:DNA-directed RNA polymerase specialized sigma24 family protein
LLTNDPGSGNRQPEARNVSGNFSKAAAQRFRSTPSDELLARLRAGDRESAAEFIQRFAALIRRRCRHKLSGSMRRLFDSQEILSTVTRRLDQYVRTGRFNCVSEQQLWSLIFRIADNSIVDKARVYRRLQEVEDEEADFARAVANRLRVMDERFESGAELELDNIFSAIESERDKEILSLWLHGNPHYVIAVHLDMSSAAVRQRWLRIKDRIRDHLGAEMK